MVLIRDNAYQIPAAILMTIISCVLLFIGQDVVSDAVEHLTRPQLVETQGELRSLSKGESRRPGRDGTGVFPLVGSYTFTVSGKQYSGNQIGPFVRSTLWESFEANKLTQSFQRDKQVAVRYDPKNPDKNYADVGGDF